MFYMHKGLIKVVIFITMFLFPLPLNAQGSSLKKGEKPKQIANRPAPGNGITGRRVERITRLNRGPDVMPAKTNASARRKFMKTNPCPGTGKTYGPCPGWEVAHIVPTAEGGDDTFSNMRWRKALAGKANALTN